MTGGLPGAPVTSLGSAPERVPSAGEVSPAVLRGPNRDPRHQLGRMPRAVHLPRAQPCLRMLEKETVLNPVALAISLSSGCRGWGQLKLLRALSLFFTCFHFSIIYILMSLVL